MWDVIHGVAQRVGRLPVAGSYLRHTLGPRLNLGLRHRAKHPIDQALGIDTSGWIDQAHDGNGYLGTQPSAIRDALNALPPVHGFTFVDLGCGKGRVNVVASEYPFARNIGVELSPELARIGRKNAAHIAATRRKVIDIVPGNATYLPKHLGRNVVLFMFNPYGEAQVRKLLTSIEQEIFHNDIERLFVIYHNPVHANVFDASPFLGRFYTSAPEPTNEERPFSVKRALLTVIWQYGRTPPRLGAYRPVVRIAEQEAAFQ